MTTLVQAREAADYIQRFARGKRERLADLIRLVDPKGGYGDGVDVAFAHKSALFMQERVSELFGRCRIPEDYGPFELRDALEGMDSELSTREDRLRNDINASQARDEFRETLGWVIVEVIECRRNIAVALDLMGTPPAPGGTDTFQILNLIAEKFPDVVRRLSERRAPDDPLVIKNEYDVQYLFQGLMAVFFDDMVPEEFGASVGGVASRVDTFLAPQQTLVEFKMMRPSLSSKALTSQILVDFGLYAERQEAKNLFVFVYDPGKRIKNPAGMRRQLSAPRPPIGRVQTFVQQG